MTFTSEYKLVSSPTLQGMMSAQVFSFTRLAWRVLQETGGMSRTHLTSVGLQSPLWKSLKKRSMNLKDFSTFSKQKQALSVAWKKTV